MRRAAARGARWGGVALCAVLGAACGAMGQSDDDDDDPGADAGASGDADVGCEIGVVFEPIAPVVGDTITARAIVPDASSFLTFGWDVEDAAAVDVPWTPDAADGSQIRFTPTAAGPVYVRLPVDGSSCRPYDGAVNVRALGATETPWRVRFTAPPGLGLPPVELSRAVPSGADFSIGTIALDPGYLLSATLTDGTSPVAAYLRLTPTGAPDLAIDAFAGADGVVEARTPFGNLDVLIVPFDPALAPRKLANWTPVAGPITVDAGDPITGTVRTPDDQPLAGALVTLRVGGVPTSLATTDAAGAFTVRGHADAGVITEVTVVAPAATGLPRLVSSPQVFDLTQPLAVRYAPALVTRDVGGAQARLGGAAAPGATVTFVGELAGAGTVTQGLSAAPAVGRFAIAVAAADDAGAALAAQAVPAAPATAVVATAAGAGLVAVDLTAAPPAVVDGAAPLADAGRVVDGAGAPIAGADVRAVPQGALAAAGAAEVHVVAAGDGTFTLPLAGRGAYELLVVDRGGGHALARVATVAQGEGVGDVVLPDGLRLSGKVTYNGSVLPAVAVTVFCGDCTGPARALPAALAGTSSAGTYRATVVDPGVTP